MIVQKEDKNSILVADSTKFGKIGPVKYANISDFDRLIVDDGLSADDLREYKSNGVTIHRV